MNIFIIFFYFFTIIYNLIFVDFNWTGFIDELWLNQWIIILDRKFDINEYTSNVLTKVRRLEDIVHQCRGFGQLPELLFGVDWISFLF